MIRKTGTLVAAVLLAACIASSALGQAPPPTILVVNVENQVEYQQDISDPSKFATNPNLVPSVPPKNFFVATLLADIVAINGQPAKGLYAGRTRVIGAFPVSPNPGQAIADVRRTAIREHIFEILKSDGTAIGTIIGVGFSGGSPPPGSPSAQTGGNWAIVGGTGAFLGARGQIGAAQTPGAPPTGRPASMAEDPANRRLNGGGIQPFVLNVIPMSVPQIVTTATGPAITHSNDFSLVTAAKPAAAGEVLSLFATGLGPTVPGIDLGQPFPSSPPATVNSPVAVMVNGKPAEVLGAVGFPGAVDGYQVNFRMPSDTAQGPASIQVSAAWITGPAVNIRVQQ